MEQEPWTLESGDSNINIRSPHGIVATLTYPVSEGGPIETQHVKEVAHLLLASPLLLEAVQLLLAVSSKTGSRETSELKTAMAQGERAIVVAMGK